MTSKKIKPWSEVQKGKARAALRHFHAAGRSLQDYAHPLPLDRPATGQLRLARDAGLVFEVALKAKRQAELS